MQKILSKKISLKFVGFLEHWGGFFPIKYGPTDEKIYDIVKEYGCFCFELN